MVCHWKACGTALGDDRCSITLYRETDSKKLCGLNFILRFDINRDREQRMYLTSFAWILHCGTPLLKTVRRLICRILILPLTNNHSFIQYKAKKPDKFGIKFWMVVDAETKYLYDCFLYLAKNESRDTSVSLETHVVMKLMQPIFKRACL